MNERFIYVFKEADRDALLKAGYKLLNINFKSPGQTVYIFVNSDQIKFSFDSIVYVTSNTISF